MELFRIQAVKEKGDGGVAWGLAQAEVGQEVGVGAGEAFHAPQGVHFGEDLEEGRLELFRIQAVKEKGDGGVAWGLAQA
ncbi:hypothetical protein, partial [Streptococcus pneumoniae]|uniref:hypothetical protein n=1 Tax=Streptococcus pneumoniae TaxID=1313 RepID=UPI00166222D0